MPCPHRLSHAHPSFDSPLDATNMMIAPPGFDVNARGMAHSSRVSLETALSQTIAYWTIENDQGPCFPLIRFISLRRVLVPECSSAEMDETMRKRDILASSGGMALESTGEGARSIWREERRGLGMRLSSCSVAGWGETWVASLSIERVYMATTSEPWASSPSGAGSTFTVMV